MAPLTTRDLGLLTIPEAAAVAGVSAATVRVWITRYRLPTTRLQGRVVVSELALLDCERDRRRSRAGRPRRAERSGDAL